MLIRSMCSGNRPIMRLSVFNCSTFYPLGTITLMRRVVSDLRSDWSKMHSNCDDNSRKTQFALMVGVASLVGIIRVLISNISCFSSLLCGKRFSQHA